MPGKPWTEKQILKLKTLYLDEMKSTADCAKALKRTQHAVAHKISQIGFNKLRKDAKAALPKESPPDVKKGNALAEAFTADTAARAAHATSKAFESFEHESNKEAVDDRDLDKMEQAMKIAERASAMARKNLGLEGPAAGAGGGNVFNVYFSEGVEIRKVDPDEGDTIDV